MYDDDSTRWGSIPSSPSISFHLLPLEKNEALTPPFLLSCRWWRTKQNKALTPFPLGELFPLRLGCGWWPEALVFAGVYACVLFLPFGWETLLWELFFSLFFSSVLYSCVRVYHGLPKECMMIESGETTLAHGC